MSITLRMAGITLGAMHAAALTPNSSDHNASRFQAEVLQDADVGIDALRVFDDVQEWSRFSQQPTSQGCRPMCGWGSSRPYKDFCINAPLNSTGPVGPRSLRTPPSGSRLMARVGTACTCACDTVK